MSRLLRTSLAVAATGLVLASLSCSRSSKTTSAFPDSLVDDEVVVRVNSQPVTGRDLRVFALIYQPGSADSLRTAGFNRKLLDGFIDRVLLEQEVRAAGITVTDSLVEEFVSRYTQALGGPEGLRRRVLDAGVTRDEVRETIRRDLGVRRFIETVVAAEVDVSEDDARAWFEANRDRLAVEDSVRARHIILRRHDRDTDADRAARREKLEGIRRRALAGEDFAELARRYSEGPSAASGGDLGYFARRDMVPAFAEVAFSLEPGTISDIVETPFGLHLIRVEDHKKASPIRFEDVRDRIVQGLHDQRLKDVLGKHLKRNREAAIIEYTTKVGA